MVSLLYILEAALNHLDSIKSITSNVKFDFVICSDKGWWRYNVQENDNNVGYVNSGGDGCDFGHDNGSGEKE